MEVLGKDLVKGDFYHSYSTHLCGEAAFNDVWYSNGLSLINPRDKDHGRCTVGTYYPLTIEEVDAFTNWMGRNGDEAGIKAWNKYKEKLIKEAEMAKNNDVDLYNPKFVHFEWSEDLKDKEGFYGDLIDELRADVRNGRETGVCDRLGNPGFPFHIEKVDSVYKFFYYDPDYEVKWAYFKEGKVIQIRREGCEWFDVLGHYDPEFFDGDDRYEFRIKPEEEPHVEVNVDVNINNAASNGKIKITINGKECIFENAEQAKMVLNS